MKDFLDLLPALDNIIKPVVSPGGLVCAMLHVSNSVTILYHRQKVHACGHFSSSPRGSSALDPCAGTGAALHQLAAEVEVEKQAVELDMERAAVSTASGIATVHGNLFDTVGRVESFSFLYLNPPYDSEIGFMGNKRMEYLCLEHTFRWLVERSVLLMVVPQERLEPTIPLLAGNFTDLQVFRLTDPEAQRFDQVALFGVRKRMLRRAL
jgi:tRNA1(Val) A37 N6-methylase TrmN6